MHQLFPREIALNTPYICTLRSCSRPRTPGALQRFVLRFHLALVCSRLLRFSVLSASPITLVYIFWSLCAILLCVLSWCRVRILLDGATAFPRPAGRSIVYYGSCGSRIVYCGASQNIYDDISFGLPHLGESFGHAHRALLMYSAEELPASLLWETVQTTAICLP